MGWRVEWSLVMGDTLPYLFRQDGALVRARLYSVISDADLIARHQALRVWQQTHDCVVVSQNPEDRDLPIVPTSDLPQDRT